LWVLRIVSHVLAGMQGAAVAQGVRARGAGSQQVPLVLIALQLGNGGVSVLAGWWTSHGFRVFQATLLIPVWAAAMQQCREREEGEHGRRDDYRRDDSRRFVPSPTATTQLVVLWTVPCAVYVSLVVHVCVHRLGDARQRLLNKFWPLPYREEGERRRDDYRSSDHSRWARNASPDTFHGICAPRVHRQLSSRLKHPVLLLFGAGSGTVTAAVATVTGSGTVTAAMQMTGITSGHVGSGICECPGHDHRLD